MISEKLNREDAITIVDKELNTSKVLKEHPNMCTSSVIFKMVLSDCFMALSRQAVLEKRLEYVNEIDTVMIIISYVYKYLEKMEENRIKELIKDESSNIDG